jgi:molecular chaperone GrpE
MSHKHKETHDNPVANEEEETLNTSVPDETSEKETEASLAAQEDVQPSLQEQITALEAQLKEANNEYLRVHADFENIKKRLEREKYQAIEFSQEKFAKDLLGVYDALNGAVQIEDPAQFAQLKEGVKHTFDALVKTFEKHYVTPLSHDEGFDPNKHEAVMQIPSETHESNEVVQVLQQGFAIRDRVLRPSLVSVAQ